MINFKIATFSSPEPLMYLYDYTIFILITNVNVACPQRNNHEIQLCLLKLTFQMYFKPCILLFLFTFLRCTKKFQV